MLSVNIIQTKLPNLLLNGLKSTQVYLRISDKSESRLQRHHPVQVGVVEEEVECTGAHTRCLYEHIDTYILE